MAAETSRTRPLNIEHRLSDKGFYFNLLATSGQTSLSGDAIFLTFRTETITSLKEEWHEKW